MIYKWLTDLPEYLTKWGIFWYGYGNWETNAAQLPPDTYFEPKGMLNHHTAGPAWYPKDKLTTKCNMFIDPDGVVWIMSLGYQFDSGMGDPAVLERVLYDQPIEAPQDYIASERINGNPWFIDVEVGHPGDGSPIPQPQRDALIKVNAAVCDMMGWSPKTRVLGHKEWTRRKIDPRWEYDGAIDTMEHIRFDTVYVMETAIEEPTVPTLSLFVEYIRSQDIDELVNTGIITHGEGEYFKTGDPWPGGVSKVKDHPDWENLYNAVIVRSLIWSI